MSSCLVFYRSCGGSWWNLSLSASRTFIPWSSLEDFLINEGIRGWDIRYYLVAITRTSQGDVKLQVAFEVRRASSSRI